MVGRLECRILPIHQGGHPYGAETAVFHVGRTDVDLEEDVPVMEAPSDTNTESKSWRIQHKGDKLYHVEGEFWRDEWIEPGGASPRVRRDKMQSTSFFVIDAGGEPVPADKLNDEDIGRWLWFSPAVISALMNRRGGCLVWYTRETGGVGASQ